MRINTSQAALSFSWVIVMSIMAAILSAVGISVIRIPIDTTVCTVMSTHFTAREFDFLLCLVIFHCIHLHSSRN